VPGRRLLVAAIPLCLLIALYGMFLATSNLIPARAMTAAVLICVGVITILLADPHDPPVVGWLTPVLALPATVCAVLAMTQAPELFRTLAIATTLALWTVQLAEHLTFGPPRTVRVDPDDPPSATRGPVAQPGPACAAACSPLALDRGSSCSDDGS
jgi:hypothetical protein